MQIGFETIREILEHRLHQEDIEKLLHGLDEAGKAELFFRITEMLRRTTALADIANRVSDSLSLDVLFPRLMAVVTEALNADRSSLFLHDPETNELFSRVMQGDAIGEIRFPCHLGVAGSVFTRGEAEIIADAYADPRFNQEVDRRTGYRTRNILCVPIRNKNREVIGITQVLNKQAGDFDGEDQRLLEGLSLQASAALENARLFEKVERQQREEAMLLEVSISIVAEIHLDPLLAKIMAAATSLLDADRGTLFLYDASRPRAVLPRCRRHRRRGDPLPGGCRHRRRVLQQRPGDQHRRCLFGFPLQSRLRPPHRLSHPQHAVHADRRPRRAQDRRHADPQPQGRRLRQRRRAAPAGILGAGRGRHRERAVVRGRHRRAQLQRSHPAQHEQRRADARCRRHPEEGQRVGAAHPAPRRRGAARPPLDEIFLGRNGWVAKSLEKVRATGSTDITVDTDLFIEGSETISVNLATVQLNSLRNEPIGYMLMMEDITREKRLRNTMSRYMSKTVVDQLLASGEVELGGTGRDVSVLFSDIRGFTSISERLGAKETVALLNEYFTDMVDIVFAHNGVLDKYIGDMIMAVFGSVLQSEEDASNAVTVGNKMLTALHQLNRRRAERGDEAIRIGVGISTGNVVAGNIGSLKRMEYTVVGDRVNLAERLESANKFYGTSILICDATWEAVRHHAAAREIDLIRVRGRDRPVAIYEALGHHSEDSFPHREEALAAFSEGLLRYRRRDWAGAEHCFSAALAANPEDGPSKIYFERCRIYGSTPPPATWDGVWTMPNK
jgi:adenylate cyclase